MYLSKILKIPFQGRAKKVTFSIGAMVLAVVLLAMFIYRSGSISELWATLKITRNHRGFLVAGISLFSVSLLCGMVRWYVLLRVLKLPVPFRDAFKLYATGHFFNILGPGATGGDLVKAAWVAVKCPGRRTEAITSIFTERLIGFVAMIFFVSTISVFRKDFFDESKVLTLFRHLIYFAFAGCVALVLLLTVIDWERLAARVHPKKGGFIEKTLEIMIKTWKTFRICLTHPRATLLAFALSIMNHITDVTCYYLLSRSISMTLPVRDLLVISPIANTIAAVPLTPGGAGVRENTLQYMMDVVKVPRPESTALGILMFCSIIFWAVISGMIMLSGIIAHRKETVTEPVSDTMDCT